MKIILKEGIFEKIKDVPEWMSKLNIIKIPKERKLEDQLVLQEKPAFNKIQAIEYSNSGISREGIVIFQKIYDFSD